MGRLPLICGRKTQTEELVLVPASSMQDWVEAFAHNKSDSSSCIPDCLLLSGLPIRDFVRRKQKGTEILWESNKFFIVIF